MKRTLMLFLACSLVFGCCVLCSGCSTEYEVEDVYDRVVSLIEDSYEINTVIYGPGLPTYVKDSEFSELNHVYFGVNEHGSYEFVTERSKFLSVDDIKKKAEKIYSKGLLEDVLYKTLFEGYAVEDGAGGAVYGLARYRTVSERFSVTTDKNAEGKDENIFFTSMRIYDYSTMKVRSLGREDACAVAIESWLPESPEKIETVELILALQDGQWYLDSFAGA